MIILVARPTISHAASYATTPSSRACLSVWRAGRVHCLLIGSQESWIVDGTMVMHLAPPTIASAKDSAGADGEVEPHVVPLERPAFATHGVEHISDHVNRVVVEFDPHATCTLEHALVHRTNFRPAAFDTAQWVVHGGGVG